MRTLLIFLMCTSLSTAHAGSRALVPAPRPPDPPDVGRDFVDRLATSGAHVNGMVERLRLMIGNIAAEQPALEQFAPLAIPRDFDPDRLLDTRTRALAEEFAHKYALVRRAAAEGDLEAVRIATTNALEVMARAYALSSINLGNRLSLQSWSAHLGGASVGVTVTALIGLILYLRTLEEPNALLNSLTAIFAVVAVGNVVHLRKNWRKLVDPEQTLAVWSVLRTKSLRARVARQNIEFFWNEVVAVIAEGYHDGPEVRSVDDVMKGLARALDERTLIPACERLLAHQSSVREVRVP